MSKKLFNTIILINHCIPGLGPSQFTPKLATYSTWDRLPSSTCWSALSSPCTSLHSSLHARGCFYHIFLHCACRCPKQSSCMWLFAFPHAVWFCGRASPQGLFWCMGSKLPLPSSLFGLETSICLYTFITSFCTGHVAAQTTFVYVVVCFPTGRLILRVGPPKGLFRCMGSKLPPAIFIVWARNIQTSVCIGSVALPELGSPDLGVDILKR